MYLSSREIAQKWNVSERRVRILCMQNRIPGAYQSGYQWLIPIDAVRPRDGRLKKAESLIELIDRKKERLASCRPLTAGEADRLAEEFAVECTYNSDAIEGNVLTLRETDMVLRGLTVGEKPLKDHIEAIGHRDAFIFVRKQAEEKQPLTEELIKKVHSFVLADKRDDGGVYRRIPVRIAGAKTIPASPALISEKMKQAIVAYQNSQEHIISRLARLHLEFETIQPFIDGNGRTGRLLTNFELMKAGFPPINIKAKDQKVYFNAFDAYADKGAVTAMEDLFARCLCESLDDRLRMLGE